MNWNDLMKRDYPNEWKRPRIPSHYKQKEYQIISDKYRQFVAATGYPEDKVLGRVIVFSGYEDNDTYCPVCHSPFNGNTHQHMSQLCTIIFEIVDNRTGIEDEILMGILQKSFPPTMKS